MLYYECDLKSTKERGENMTNTLELEVAIVRANIKKKELANELGISQMGLYKKINNVTEFKASEISKLTGLLNLNTNEQKVIFFTQNSDLKSTIK